MKKATAISVSQLFIMLFLSRMIVNVTYSTFVADINDMWYSVASSVIAFIITLVMAAPVYLLYKEDKNLSVSDNGYVLLGKAGVIISLIYAVYFLWVLVYTLTLFDLFVTDLMNPTISAFVLSLAVIAASVYGAWKGIEAIGRASTIVLIAVIAAGIFLICSLFPKIDVNNYTPILWENADSVWKGTVGLIAKNSCIPAMAMLLQFVRGKVKKGIVFWAATVYGSIALLITVITGVLGDYIKTQVFPVYTATSIAEWGVLERLDGIFLGVWTAGMFIKISLFIYLLSACIKRMFGDLASRVSIIICGVIVLCISMAAANYSVVSNIVFNSNILLILTVLTAFVIPLILLIIKKYRKNKKRKENAV